VARVDFHSQVGDKLSYTCRLARKIFSLASGKEALKKLVILGSSEDLKKLDTMLWSFDTEEFLPHCMADEDNAVCTPILLATHYDEALFEHLAHQDVLIHIGQDVLQDIEKISDRFERVIEVVSLEEADVQAGRQRYKQYRDLGLELVNHDQKGAK